LAVGGSTATDGTVAADDVGPPALLQRDAKLLIEVCRIESQTGSHNQTLVVSAVA
jgi:hypothetical protein